MREGSHNTDRCKFEEPYVVLFNLSNFYPSMADVLAESRLDPGLLEADVDSDNFNMRSVQSVLRSFCTTSHEWPASGFKAQKLHQWLKCKKTRTHKWGRITANTQAAIEAASNRILSQDKAIRTGM